MRIKLPTSNYKAELYDKKSQTFKDVVFDVLEQQHFNSESKTFIDYEMFVFAELGGDSFNVLKLT